MTEYVNKREYDRYPVSLKAQVSSFDEAGEEFSESGTIKDISGGGANLLTEHAERYFIGQKVDLKISLPGAEVLNADMHGHAMVVWIAKDAEGQGDGSGSIGLCMNDLLAFEHLIEASNSGERSE